jgi:hypothetical protein
LDAEQFDVLTRALFAGSSRRVTLGLALGGFLGALGLADVDARKKGKKKKKSKNKQPTPPPPPPPPGGGCTPNCVGQPCGGPDGCNGQCQTGPCSGSQQCVNGACRDSCPTAVCGGACVDTQTSEQHCGSCGNACTGGKSCVGGQCVAEALSCTSAADCGGGGGALTCNPTTQRCVCAIHPTWGICQRFPNGDGLCGPCCPGGIPLGSVCDQERVCIDQSINGCACPASAPEGCPSRSGFCSMDTDTDPHRCGPACQDCTLADPAARCCSGVCVRGCYPGADGSCIFEPCGSNCAPCLAGEKCCNLGIGKPDICIPQNGSGSCPQPGE